MPTISTYDERELDRKERDRATGARSSLGSRMCQECGSPDGMHAMCKTSLETLPPTPDELIYTLKGDSEAIYFTCNFCNKAAIVPDGFTRLIVTSKEAHLK